MSARSISFGAIPSDSIDDRPIQIHIIQSMSGDVVLCPVMERKKIKHEFKEKRFSIVREIKAFKIKAKADLLDLDKQIKTVNHALKRSLRSKNKNEIDRSHEEKLLEVVLKDKANSLDYDKQVYIIERDLKLRLLKLDIRTCNNDRWGKLLELRRKLLEIRRRHTL